jgi:preprotein translocase subunit SecD
MFFRLSRYHLTLILVSGLAVAALLVDLPRIPIKFSIQQFKVDTSIGGYSLSLGSFQRDLQLKKGLDLSGGAQMIFRADMSGVAPADKAASLAGLKNIMERRVNLLGVSEPQVQTAVSGGDYRVIVELPGVANASEALKVVGQTAQLDFRELSPTATSSADFVKTDLTGKDLTRASLNFSSTNEPEIGLLFTTDGATKFQELTKRNVGKPVAIYLDDQLLQAPQVKSEISGGNAVITGKFTVDEVKNIVIQLNAGALPTPVTLLSQSQISATLGQESVQYSLFAGIIGLLIVGIFMYGNYGKLGLLANVALVIYGLLSLALYKLIPVTLSLAGVAGFLLSIGMAVDANILIFERIKEERRMGNPLYASMELGFKRAWNSIRDSNACTLITCFVLFNPFNWSFLNVSGMVRGFALTLALGILLSLFTGIVVTRTLVRLFYR